MKKAILLSFLMALSVMALAQVPESFNYQVVVRDGTTNDPLVNQNVSFRMSILKGSSSGISQYSELHSSNTFALGIVNLVIGNGTGKTGNITTIEWGADTYFLKVEIDKNGGTAYVEMGTAQLLTVPYAMYSKKAGTATETDPVFVAHPANGITGSNITNWNSTYWAEILNIPAAFADGVDNDSWTPNTKTVAGIVTAGGSNFNKVWKTDGSGNPSWGALTASEIPDLDWTKITTGKPTTLGGYGITDGVNSTGDQIIAGNKTFSGTTTVAEPVNATDAATKAYVDSKTPVHYIGESYGGGIVFYVYDNGQHGLIASTADYGGWAWTIPAFQSTLSFVLRDGINGGLANTERIMAQAGAGNYAASLCSGYNGGNYADWYLPSKYELNLLYQQKTVVGGFVNGDYWSSTEYSSIQAWAQNFEFGGNYGTGMSKGSAYYVRAIRAF